MKKKNGQANHWVPPAHSLALYQGKSTLSKDPFVVEVLGAARSGRTMVRTIGRAGKTVQITVLTANLSPAPLTLFDE